MLIELMMIPPMPTATTAIVPMVLMLGIHKRDCKEKFKWLQQPPHSFDPPAPRFIHLDTNTAMQCKPYLSLIAFLIVGGGTEKKSTKKH
jgi:hypothetical protein